MNDLLAFVPAALSVGELHRISEYRYLRSEGLVCRYHYVGLHWKRQSIRTHE